MTQYDPCTYRKREDMRTDMENTIEGQSRDGNEAAPSPGAPRIASYHQKLGRSKAGARKDSTQSL